MIRNLRLLSLFASTVALALCLAACKGLDSSQQDENGVFIGDADAAPTCGNPAQSITLDVRGAQMLENWPLPDLPDQATNVARVSGVASGLAAGQSVYLVVVDDVADCPVAHWQEVVPDASGSFTGVVEIDLPNGFVIDRFRVQAIAGPAAATAGCNAAGDCIELTAGGTQTNPSAGSNAILFDRP
jgi:hypothetical protein